MLRINSASVLFVPPFECAWLSELSIGEGGGCLSFEAKGTFCAVLLPAVWAKSLRLSLAVLAASP